MNLSLYPKLYYTNIEFPFGKVMFILLGNQMVSMTLLLRNSTKYPFLQYVDIPLNPPQFY